MPRVKPFDCVERKRIVKACICANQERYGYTDEQLAKLLCITERTFKKKKDDPDTFTLQEIHYLNKTLKFTPIQAATIVLERDITKKEVKDFILM